MTSRSAVPCPACRGAGIAHLSPRTLRDLAAAIEARTPGMRARRALTAEGIERLADILLAGTTPTVGFYRRHVRTETR
jgi:hypothetical protein